MAEKEFSEYEFILEVDEPEYLWKRYTLGVRFFRAVILWIKELKSFITSLIYICST